MEDQFIAHARNTLYAYARARCGGDSTVRRAVAVAGESHRNQLRDGGEAYIIHPLRVATHFLVFWDEPGLTQSDVASAVLHDVLEDDPDMSLGRLAEEFGADVADAVFRLSRKTPQGTLTPAQYRGTLLESSRKVQVIKLCDRLDNILSLYSCPDAAKVQRYLDQTAEFYGPLGEKANLPDLTRSILEEVEQLRGPASDG